MIITRLIDYNTKSWTRNGRLTVHKVNFRSGRQAFAYKLSGGTLEIWLVCLLSIVCSRFAGYLPLKAFLIQSCNMSITWFSGTWWCWTRYILLRVSNIWLFFRSRSADICYGFTCLLNLLCRFYGHNPSTYYVSWQECSTSCSCTFISFWLHSVWYRVRHFTIL